MTRRNLKGGRTVAENHTSGREAPAPRRVHRRYKSPALCYDPENAPHDALATCQRPAKRLSRVFAHVYVSMSQACKIGFRRLISGTSRPTPREWSQSVVILFIESRSSQHWEIIAEIRAEEEFVDGEKYHCWKKSHLEIEFDNEKDSVTFHSIGRNINASNCFRHTLTIFKTNKYFSNRKWHRNVVQQFLIYLLIIVVFVEFVSSMRSFYSLRFSYSFLYFVCAA